VRRISQVVDDRAVRSGASAVGEDLLEVDGAVEGEGTVGGNIDPVTLEVGWGVENRDLLPGTSVWRHERDGTIAVACGDWDEGRWGQQVTSGSGGYLGRGQLTSPACTKYPVTRRFFLFGDSLT